MIGDRRQFSGVDNAHDLCIHQQSDSKYWKVTHDTINCDDFAENYTVVKFSMPLESLVLL